MIESPIYQELEAELTRKGATEATRKAIIEILRARFKIVPAEIEAEFKTIDDERLDELVKRAAKCRSLASFRKQLSS